MMPSPWIRIMLLKSLFICIAIDFDWKYIVIVLGIISIRFDWSNRKNPAKEKFGFHNNWKKK